MGNLNRWKEEFRLIQTKDLQKISKKLAPNLGLFLDKKKYFEKVTDGYYQLRLGITHNDLEVGITEFLKENNIPLPDEIIENIKTLLNQKKEPMTINILFDEQKKIRGAVEELRVSKRTC